MFKLTLISVFIALVVADLRESLTLSAIEEIEDKFAAPFHPSKLNLEKHSITQMVKTSAMDIAEYTTGYVKAVEYNGDDCSSDSFGTTYYPLGKCVPDKKKSNMFVSSTDNYFTLNTYSDTTCGTLESSYSFNYGPDQCYGSRVYSYASEVSATDGITVSWYSNKALCKTEEDVGYFLQLATECMENVQYSCSKDLRPKMTDYKKDCTKKDTTNFLGEHCYKSQYGQYSRIQCLEY